MPRIRGFNPQTLTQKHPSPHHPASTFPNTCKWSTQAIGDSSNPLLLQPSKSAYVESSDDWRDLLSSQCLCRDAMKSRREGLDAGAGVQRGESRCLGVCKRGKLTALSSVEDERYCTSTTVGGPPNSHRLHGHASIPRIQTLEPRAVIQKRLGIQVPASKRRKFFSSSPTFSPSAYSSLARPSPFSSLPAEVLEYIFLYSQSLSLPMVNLHFHASLSSETILLRFCTQIFSCSPSSLRAPWLLRRQTIAQLQTQIFQQRWFTVGFAESVEEKVIKAQKLRIEAERKSAPNLYSGVWPFPKNKLRCNRDACIPTVLTRNPWTKGKVELVRMLHKWGARVCLDLKSKQQLTQLLKNAVLRGDCDGCKLLHDVYGIGFTHAIFKDAAFEGPEEIVRLIVKADFESDIQFIDWEDQRLGQWLRRRAWARGVTEEWVLRDGDWSLGWRMMMMWHYSDVIPDVMRGHD